MILNMIIRVFIFIFQLLRIVAYYIISDNKVVVSFNQIKQPVMFNGKGVIDIKKTAKFGYKFTQGFYSSYGYIEARNKRSKIVIGDNVWINNNISLVSEGKGIEIGDNSLIGHDVEIIDSDFHELLPTHRIDGIPRTGKVLIRKNVFIGNYVRICKGVTIGENSVIGIGSVVFNDIPSNCIASGNPAKVISLL